MMQNRRQDLGQQRFDAGMALQRDTAERAEARHTEQMDFRREGAATSARQHEEEMGFWRGESAVKSFQAGRRETGMMKRAEMSGQTQRDIANTYAGRQGGPSQALGAIDARGKMAEYGVTDPREGLELLDAAIKTLTAKSEGEVVMPDADLEMLKRLEKDRAMMVRMLGMPAGSAALMAAPQQAGAQPNPAAGVPGDLGQGGGAALSAPEWMQWMAGDSSAEPPPAATGGGAGPVAPQDHVRNMLERLTRGVEAGDADQIEMMSHLFPGVGSRPQDILNALRIPSRRVGPFGTSTDPRNR